jgi:hypothetical protein
MASPLKPIAKPTRPPKEIIGKVLADLQSIQCKPGQGYYNWMLITVPGESEKAVEEGSEKVKVMVQSGIYDARGAYMLMRALRDAADKIEERYKQPQQAPPQPGLINPN